MDTPNGRRNAPNKSLKDPNAHLFPECTSEVSAAIGKCR